MATTSLITEVLQQLQKSSSGLWRPETPTNDFQNITNSSLGKTLQTPVPPLSPNIIQNGNSTPAQPKRMQVPKACSNCRKMHAGCDLERPCRRCIQNGLESSCVDVPRKKRQSRKKQKTDEPSSPQSTPVLPSLKEIQDQTKNMGLVPLSSSQQNNYPKQEESTIKLIEDTFNELFGSPQIEQQLQQMTSTPTSGFNSELNPYSYQPESLILTEMPSTPNPFQPQPSPQMATNFAEPIQSTPSPRNNNNNNNNNISPTDLSFLVSQIGELRESNKSLENKLLGVTNELLDIRKQSVTPSTVESKALTLGGWHSFGQSDLAISVWKAMPTLDSAQCPRNILIEANQKFVSLLGYSLDVLKNNFACTNMVRKQDICPDARDNKNSREWPKRTQIITAYGLKDVYITIAPVNDQKTAVAKYFLVYIMEATA